MRLNLNNLGVWTEAYEFSVHAERTTAYTAAIDDNHPMHTAGRLAPPMFAFVPAAGAFARAMDLVIAPADRRWGLHGEQDMFLHRPVAPGTVLRSRAVAIGVHRMKAGTVLTIKTVTKDAQGETVNEQYGTAIFPGITGSESAGEKAPDHQTPVHVKGMEPLASVTYTLAPDQTHRYAEASGDRSAIHLDPDFARSVGLPGIIVHGMCTMAFAGRAVIASVCGSDSTRLKRLAVRFARPVLPGQEITTRIWAAGRRDGRVVYAFEVHNPGREAVIQDGLAEVVG